MFKNLVPPNIDTLKKNNNVDGLLKIISDPKFNVANRIKAAMAMGEMADIPLLEKAMKAAGTGHSRDDDQVKEAALTACFTTAENLGASKVFDLWLAMGNTFFDFRELDPDRPVMRTLARLGDQAVDFLVSVVLDPSQSDAYRGPKHRAVQTLDKLSNLRAFRPMLDYRMNTVTTEWKPGDPQFSEAIKHMPYLFANLRLKDPREFKNLYLDCSDREKKFLRGCTGILDKKSWPDESDYYDRLKANNKTT